MSENLQAQYDAIMAAADPEALRIVRAYEQIATIYEIAARQYALYLAYAYPVHTYTTNNTKRIEGDIHDFI